MVLRDTMATAEARDVTPGMARLNGRCRDYRRRSCVTTENHRTDRLRRSEVDDTDSGHDRLCRRHTIRRGKTVTLPTEYYTFVFGYRSLERSFGLERVFVETTVDAETAGSNAAGASLRRRDEAAEVRTVTTDATQNTDRRRVLVGLSLATLENSDRQQFGSVAVAWERRHYFANATRSSGTTNVLAHRTAWNAHQSDGNPVDDRHSCGHGRYDRTRHDRS
ncbi:hypothetical protein C8039_08200 [Halogeometricum sp. wsp3]|nr:hypothetical protein C8039_08200 [Halogeometricum sp. wsp3]